MVSKTNSYPDEDASSFISLPLGKRLKESFRAGLILFLISMEITMLGEMADLMGKPLPQTKFFGIWFEGVAHRMFSCFGWVSFFIPLALLFWLFASPKRRGRQTHGGDTRFYYAIFELLAFSLLIVSLCGFTSLTISHPLLPNVSSGGLVGAAIETFQLKRREEVPVMVILLIGCAVGMICWLGHQFETIIFFFVKSLFSLVTLIAKAFLRSVLWVLLGGVEAVKAIWFQPKNEKSTVLSEGMDANGWELLTGPEKHAFPTEGEPTLLRENEEQEPVSNEPSPALASSQASLPVLSEPVPVQLPLASDKLLVTEPLSKDEAEHYALMREEEYARLTERLPQVLAQFKIEALLISLHIGPLVTLLELQLAAGVKIAKILSLEKDIARALAVTSLRVLETIAGTTHIGIEVAREVAETVRLGLLLKHPSFKNREGPLPLAFGVDTQNRPFIINLTKLPHLLVAGTTGSGKSMTIHTLILSLLMRSSPAELRCVLVDPKFLEFSSYEGLPHLLFPVITALDKAIEAIKWLVTEMELRLKFLALNGFKNIQAYNEASHLDGAEPHLPYLLLVLDEYADMMASGGKQLELDLTRLAQKGRAAGIHMILATQRPSVDVVTGILKANIPARLSLMLFSKTDSRVVLDQSGAEKLMGRGDMLLSVPYQRELIRLHAPLIDPHEIEQLVNYWKNQVPESYLSSLDSTESKEMNTMAEEDPLLKSAMQFVLATRRVSASALQRRFKIGYNRAANLMETMETIGLVSSIENGVRTLVSSGPLDKEMTTIEGLK